MACVSEFTPITKSAQPIATGSSVIGMCYDDGVVIAADTLVSYGRMARFRNCSRMVKVNSTTVAGCGGDYADFQYTTQLIDQLQIEEETYDDGLQLSPKALHSWLTRLLYNRRSKFDPLWTNWVVGGIDNGKPFLGAVNHIGTAYVDKHASTGFGEYLVVPLMRKFYNDKNGRITKDEAIDFIKQCMTNLLCLDCSAHPVYEIAVIDETGSEIIGPLRLSGDWSNLHRTRTLNFIL